MEIQLEQGSGQSGNLSSDAKTTQSGQQPNQTPDRAIDPLAAVAELLRGPQEPVRDAPLSGAQSEGDASQGDQDGAQGEAPKGTPNAVEHDGTLTDFAEKAGLDAETAYSLKVTNADGETMTLGQLKDAWDKRSELAVEVTRRELDLDGRETSIRDDMTLLADLQGELEGKLSAAQLQRLKQRGVARQTKEQAAMRAALPEFNDKMAMEKFRADTAEMLKGYGFRPAEMVINDHRLLVIFRDLQRANARLARLTETAKGYENGRKNPPKALPSEGRGRPLIKSNQLAPNASNDAKAAAVAALLKG